MSAGIVVDHKESQVRFAIPAENFNPAIHTRVRDLRLDESVLSYRPKEKGDIDDLPFGEQLAQNRAEEADGAHKGATKKTPEAPAEDNKERA